MKPLVKWMVRESHLIPLEQDGIKLRVDPTDVFVFKASDVDPRLAALVEALREAVEGWRTVNAEENQSSWLNKAEAALAQEAEP